MIELTIKSALVHYADGMYKILEPLNPDSTGLLNVA